jgi:glyoxalase family protein
MLNLRAMPESVAGIHHVTAMCGPPQVNVDFYVETLGLRLVKRTVNFDDPGMYHFYYGDESGRPGTLLTFFPLPGAVRGRVGSGMPGATAFAVAPGSIDYWTDRLAHQAHEFLTPEERFGERVLPLHDPDGTPLEIVERNDVTGLDGWETSHVLPEHRLRSIDGITLLLERVEETGSILSDLLGYAQTGDDGGRLRFESPGATVASRIDLVTAAGPGGGGAGTVHHVAFRARDDAHQAQLGESARQMGLHVTEVKDRKYFRSIYFREPGGILFEIATDGPGMTIDEDIRHLGSELCLPVLLEERRPEIERRLVEIAIPT